MAVIVRREGYAPASDWLNGQDAAALRDWWGTCARLLRESVRGVPDWAEYVDRDGGAWTRAALYDRMISDAVEAVGQASVDKVIRRYGSEWLLRQFDTWLKGLVWGGELVRLVGEGEA